MKSLLIKDTTKEERMAIIEESVGDDAGGCDGCSAGILKMYEPYIEGKMELAQYISGKDHPVKTECGYMGR